jgi:hypothetical protein
MVCPPSGGEGEAIGRPAPASTRAAAAGPRVLHEQGDLDAAVERELRQQAGDVRLDRRDADVQLGRDLRVRAAPADGERDLVLACAESREALARRFAAVFAVAPASIIFRPDLAVQPATVLLPIVGILPVSSEWSQRTALITFTLVPRPMQVLVAKLVAGPALALVANADSARHTAGRGPARRWRSGSRFRWRSGRGGSCAARSADGVRSRTVVHMGLTPHGARADEVITRFSPPERANRPRGRGAKPRGSPS